jgi:hypothetical protein
MRDDEPRRVRTSLPITKVPGSSRAPRCIWYCSNKQQRKYISSILDLLRCTPFAPVMAAQ